MLQAAWSLVWILAVGIVALVGLVFENDTPGVDHGYTVLLLLTFSLGSVLTYAAQTQFARWCYRQEKRKTDGFSSS